MPLFNILTCSLSVIVITEEITDYKKSIVVFGSTAFLFTLFLVFYDIDTGWG